MTAVSELSVVPSPADVKENSREVEEVERSLLPQKRSAVSAPPVVTAVHSSHQGSSLSRSCLSTSASASDCPRARACDSPRRRTVSFHLCPRDELGTGEASPPPAPRNNSDHVWYSSRLAHKTIDFSLSFSSRRVRVCGSVDDVPVKNITVDTATDVPVVSLTWLRSHPTLSSIPLKSVPRSAVALRAANGEPINVLGFIDFPLTLGDLTRTVTALVVPSLGPDLILLENSVMSDFGAILDWENQTLSFSSTGSQIPAVHRIHDPLSLSSDTPVVDHNSHVSVAAVHRDADVLSVTLCETVDLKPQHECLAVAYTDRLPPEDCTVVVEPRVVTEDEFHTNTNVAPFQNIIVARTLATWHASDGSVVVQIANPSSNGVRLHPGLCLGQLSTVSVVTPDHLRVNAVANTPVL